MRFISPNPRYRIYVKHEQIETLASGQPRSLAPGFACQFTQGATDHERSIARQRLSFRGTTMQMDGTPSDPLERVSVYDTASIEDAKLRKEVEEFLLAHPDCGNSAEFIHVEELKLPAPWPSYDEIVIHGRRTAAHVAKQNLETAAQIGVGIDALIAYERENRADEEILAAYEQALGAGAEEPEPVVVA